MEIQVHEGEGWGGHSGSILLLQSDRTGRRLQGAIGAADKRT